MQPPAKSQSNRSRVTAWLRDEIVSGRWRHGEVLPSTREIALVCGVSVFTVNEAMKTLIDEGLVVSSPRSRRQVNAPGPQRGPAFAGLMSWYDPAGPGTSAGRV